MGDREREKRERLREREKRERERGDERATPSVHGTKGRDTHALAAPTRTSCSAAKEGGLAGLGDDGAITPVAAASTVVHTIVACTRTGCSMRRARRAGRVQVLGCSFMHRGPLRCYSVLLPVTMRHEGHTCGRHGTWQEPRLCPRRHAHWRQTALCVNHRGRVGAVCNASACN